MQDPTEIIEKLKLTFSLFQESTALGKVQELSKLEQICREARTYSDESYLWECCVRLIETCKQMARKRQPIGHDEQNDSAYALGQIDLIAERLLLAFETQQDPT